MPLHCPHARVQSRPCFLQEHVFFPQLSVQSQQINLRSDAGAATLSILCGLSAFPRRVRHSWFPHFFKYKIQGLFKDLSRTCQYFQGPFLCMLKKWLDDHTNKFRPKGMKNGNFGVFNTLFIKFQTLFIDICLLTLY